MKRSRTQLAVAAFLLAQPWLIAPIFAEELLFTGQVQSVTLLPSGMGNCPPSCPVSPPSKDGMVAVCVSNQGGCQDAVVTVLSDHLGSGTGMVHTFSSRTGEWGQLNIPAYPRPILIYAKDGKVTWAPVVMRDGKTYFKAAAMRGRVRNVLQTLEQDKDGEILLDRFIDKLRVGQRNQ